MPDQRGDYWELKIAICIYITSIYLWAVKSNTVERANIDFQEKAVWPSGEKRKGFLPHSNLYRLSLVFICWYIHTYTYVFGLYFNGFENLKSNFIHDCLLFRYSGL